MSAHPFPHHAAAAAQEPPARGPAPSPVLVDLLRRSAREGRARPAVDPGVACAQLDPAHPDAAPAAADALVRLVHRAVDRRAVIYAPSSAEISFDEAWLVALVTAAGRDDAASLRLLLGRRVRPEMRGPMTCLARNLARGLDLGLDKD